MSKFVQAVTLEPLEFEGDTITATLKPMKRKLFVQVLPVLQEIAAAKNALEEARLRNLTQEEMGREPRILASLGRVLDIVLPELKDYISEFKGPRDGQGAEIPLETVLEVAHFMPVQLHLAMGLVGTANVKESEAGESARPSGA